MRRARIVLGVALLGVGALLGLVYVHAAPAAQAQTSLADYAINWFTIDGGGTMASSNGEYSLSGTIGQPDAGSLSGSPHTLIGGFWAGAEPRYTIAVPIVQR